MKKFMLAIILFMFLGIAMQARADDVLINKWETHYTISALTGISKFTVPTGTYEATVQIESGPIRFFVNGTSPYGQTGFIANDKEIIELMTPYEASGFLFCLDSTGTGATVYVTFRGRR